MKHSGTILQREARMLAEAQKAVWESGEWLSVADILSQCGDDASGSDSLPQEWERAGRIFSIRYNGADYYPGYGLDQGTSIRPRPEMVEVIKVLQSTKNGWGMAFWFASPNIYLRGKRPQDVLETEQSLVIAAAENEVAGITHG